MREAGVKELQCLEALRDADRKDKKNILRLVDKFEHDGMLCLVFPFYEKNMRETVQMYGKDVGLSLDGVSAYGR